MIAVVGLGMALVGLLFGVYQWAAKRDTMRVQSECRDDLILVSFTPRTQREVLVEEVGIELTAASVPGGRHRHFVALAWLDPALGDPLSGPDLPTSVEPLHTAQWSIALKDRTWRPGEWVSARSSRHRRPQLRVLLRVQGYRKNLLPTAPLGSRALAGLKASVDRSAYL